MKLREYQRIACNDVIRLLTSGTGHVLLVAPTGAGKSIMLREIARRAHVGGLRVGAVVHTIELVEQLGEHLQTVCPGAEVVTAQALIASGRRPPWDLVVFDECHHYLAEQWKKLKDHYSDALTLGCTATPERADGQPLGDVFDKMVVATSYTSLITNGWLVPANVYQPPPQMGEGLAVDILKSYKLYGNGEQAFVFCRDVESCYDECQKFVAAGISAAVIEANTPKKLRERHLEGFKAGQISCLLNVYTLTEGVDVPQASVCIIARNIQHASTYLQIVGRVLRAAPGKEAARVIDLTGASMVHGLPTKDRNYSLSGFAISLAGQRALRVCLHCGLTFESGPVACPGCGKRAPREKRRAPIIHDHELRLVYSGPDTDEDAKQKELRRLRRIAAKQGYAMYWVIKQYRDLFGEPPCLAGCSEDEKLLEFRRQKRIETSKGYSNKWAMVRYKSTFGEWPPRDWMMSYRRPD